MKHYSSLKKWFPDIINQFKGQWNASLSNDALIKLGESLNIELTKIRKENNIIAPLYTCSGCGDTHRTEHQKLSIQAIIKAASKYCGADDEEVKSQYSQWMKFRRKKKMDLHGSPIKSNDSNLDSLHTSKKV